MKEEDSRENISLKKEKVFVSREMSEGHYRNTREMNDEKLSHLCIFLLGLLLLYKFGLV